MVVVDPGVGTARRPILASSDGYHFVAPDNGVLSIVYAKEQPIHVRHITSDHYFRQPVSHTFHGRDVFAPVAAHLAKMVAAHKFGDEIRDYVKFRVGKIVYVSVSPDESTMGFGFPKEERAALIAAEPAKLAMPRLSDQRFHWVHARMAALTPEEMRELVTDAWRMVVPKKVAAAHEAG